LCARVTEYPLDIAGRTETQPYSHPNPDELDSTEAKTNTGDAGENANEPD
jgi:hypothetical protein